MVKKLRLKTVTNIFYVVILVMLFFVAGGVVLGRMDVPYIDYKVFNVTSGSMEPSIPLGSFIVVSPQNSYSEGEVITFSRDNDLNNTTTHRVESVSVDEDLNRTVYRTKGDANEDADANTVNETNVIGKVMFHVPLLGYPIAFAKTQLGFVLLIVVPATLIIYSELMNIKNEVFGWWRNRGKSEDGLDDESKEPTDEN